MTPIGYMMIGEQAPVSPRSYGDLGELQRSRFLQMSLLRRRSPVRVALLAVLILQEPDV